MIAYVDTSAIIPILIAEPSSARCRRAWVDADRLASSRLAYVEVAAALAAAERQGRITAGEHRQAWGSFIGLWPDVDVIEVTPQIAQAAAQLAGLLALRGYDAVHCASAEAIGEPDVVAVGGDSMLLAAWQSVGLAVLDATA